jgi:hypothetical protein
LLAIMTQRVLSFRHRLIAVGLSFAGSLSAGQTGADCRREADDARRLACYDKIFGAPTAPSSASTAGEEMVPQDASTAVATFWELDPADKHGPFVVRTMPSSRHRGYPAGRPRR